MAQETRGTWTDLIGGVGLEIAEVFDQGQEQYIPALGKVIRQVGGADGAQESATGKTGIGEVERFDDGDNVPGGRRYKTYTTTVAWNNYGKNVDVTKNAIEDRDFGAELDEMKDLSMGHNFAQDKSAMQLFVGGHATTRDVNNYRMTWYGDGVALFDGSHPTVVPGASAQSNTTSNSFNHDNLETANIALEEQLTDDGLPMSLMGKPQIVLPPNLRREGLEETESTLDPETANNAINVFNQGMGNDMAVSVFLGTAGGGANFRWYLQVPQRAKLEHKTRQEARLEQDVNIKNKVVTFTIDGRWADSAKEWKRTYGSNASS